MDPLIRTPVEDLVESCRKALRPADLTVVTSRTDLPTDIAGVKVVINRHLPPDTAFVYDEEMMRAAMGEAISGAHDEYMLGLCARLFHPEDEGMGVRDPEPDYEALLRRLVDGTVSCPAWDPSPTCYETATLDGYDAADGGELWGVKLMRASFVRLMEERAEEAPPRWMEP